MTKQINFQYLRGWDQRICEGPPSPTWACQPTAFILALYPCILPDISYSSTLFPRFRVIFLAHGLGPVDIQWVDLKSPRHGENPILGAVAACESGSQMIQCRDHGGSVATLGDGHSEGDWQEAWQIAALDAKNFQNGWGQQWRSCQPQ